MGYGDDIIATGLARGAASRGKRIAFGDGRRITWGPWSAEMFKHNPNIAPPGSEFDNNIEWINHCKGHRLYNHQEGDKWIWHYDFKAKPGEFYFSPEEINFSKLFAPGFVLIEPNVPWQKTVAPNKDWGEHKYREVAYMLTQRGYAVAQFKHKNSRRILKEALTIDAGDFRKAIATLSRAALYIGPEGGLHHAAAAVGVPAVVLYGGFIPPAVVGYEGQTALTGGAEACGNFKPCLHCQAAMSRISVGEVIEPALGYLKDEMRNGGTARQG